MPATLKEWEMQIFTPEMGTTKKYLVHSDMSVSEVMVKIASTLQAGELMLVLRKETHFTLTQ